LQVGKETGGKKLEEPHSLKSNEMAQIVFKPTQPLVVDSFKNCEGLSRIAFLDGNTAVMLGKVVKVTHKEWGAVGRVRHSCGLAAAAVGAAAVSREVKLSVLRGLRMPVGVLLYLVRLHMYAIPWQHPWLYACLTDLFASRVL
jgi:hypothetical protein